MPPTLLHVCMHVRENGGVGNRVILFVILQRKEQGDLVLSLS